MKCPECSIQFKFKNIPFEDRITEKWSTAFLCPGCRAILKPDRKFEILSNVAIAVLAVGALGFLFRVWLDLGLTYPISGILAVIAIAIYWLSSANITLVSLGQFENNSSH